MEGIIDEAQCHKTLLVAMRADWKSGPGHLMMAPHPYNARSSTSEKQGMGMIRKISVFNIGGSAEHRTVRSISSLTILRMLQILFHNVDR